MFDYVLLSPNRLWALAAVGVLALLYGASLLQQRHYTVRFTNVGLLDTIAPRRPGWRRHVTAFVFLLSLASIVLAYARPAAEVKVPRERATVILTIDTSLSMKATDVSDDGQTSRLDAAKVAASQFVETLPPKINLGLVTFDGVARIRVTPTTDRAPVLHAIDTLQLGQATAIGEGIFASLDALQDAPGGEDTDEPVPARIVLMTDGKTTVGRPDLDGAAAAKQAKVEVSTIAFGTENGVISIEGQQGPTRVPVAEGELRDIAELTGGEFFRAENLEQLEKVYADIGSAVGFETEEREVTERFVGVGLLLLLGSAALSLLWFSRLP